jgi:glycerate 2-kinase
MPDFNRIGIDSKIFNTIPYSKLFIKIIKSSLQAVDPINVIKESFWIERNRIIVGDGKLILKSNQKVRVIGFGKASQFMALGVKEVLGEYLDSGVIITKHPENKVAEKLNPQILTLVGGHPIPTEESLKSTEFMLNFIEKIPENCPVICLISGGGSSLLTKPAKNISLADYRRLTDLLIKSGATINEINTVRKHVDEVKGGGLARFLYPRYLLTLIISDVIDNPLSIIASGPTSIDETTFRQALDIIDKYHLHNSIKRKIIDYLKKGVDKKIPETIKEKNPILDKVNNLIIADNSKATIAAKKNGRKCWFFV